MAYACNPVSVEAGVVGWSEVGTPAGLPRCDDPVSRARFGTGMVGSTEVGATRLTEEGCTGPGRDTQQAKAPVWNGSGIAPENSRQPAPDQNDQTQSLFFLLLFTFFMNLFSNTGIFFFK